MFAGTEFCEMESNCVATPNWIVILVPVMLGVAALILLIIVLAKLRNRKVIDRYEFIKQHTSSKMLKF